MGFLDRFGITVDRDRLGALRDQYVESLPTKDMLVAGAIEMGEVFAGAALIGAAEQRYGEEKTTLFMTDQTDDHGAVIKDDKGNPLKKSGTGLPYSAAGALLGTAISALVPMTPGTRRHVLNVSAGFGAAFGYRKGLGWGQDLLDKHNKVKSGTTGNEAGIDNPGPPFTKSAQTAVSGELNESNVVSMTQEAERILAERMRARGGR